MGHRFEVWTHPSTGLFARLIPRLPVESASFTPRNSGADSGRLTLPPRYPYLSALIVRDPLNPANDRRSVIRVFDDELPSTEPIAEMVPISVPDAINPSNPIVVNCEGVTRNFFRGTFVWAFDHPVFNQPDWIWGGANIVSNPSFEETLIKPERYSLGFDATGGTYDITVDGDTLTIAIPTTAALLQSGLLGLTTVDKVEVSGPGTIADPFAIQFSDPADPFVTIDGSALTGGGDAFTIVEGGRLLPASWEPSRNPVNNLQHGAYSFWGLLGTPTAFDGVLSMGFNGLDASSWDFPGIQQIKAITPGLYQGKARVNPASASDPYAFVIRDTKEGLADNLAGTGAKVVQTSTANVWTAIDLVDVVIKPGMEAAIIRVAYTGGGNPGEIRVDLVELRPGMAPATIGEILRLLLEDAAINHAADSPTRIALNYIDWTASFSDTLDSHGNAWDRLLSVTIPRGWTYWQVLEMFHEEFGYEFGLRPSATVGEWILDVWNPNTRGVTDPDLNPAIIVGLNAVLSGPLSFESVVGNAILAEGADRIWSRSEHAGSIAGAGRIESYIPLGNVMEQTTLDAAAAAQLNEQLDQGLSVQIVMAPGAFPVLLADLRLGDRSYISIPGYLDKYDIRLDAVTLDWKRGDSLPTRTGHWSREQYEAEVAVKEMVRRLAERAAVLNPPTPKPTQQGTGGGGGMMTITVATTSSTQSSQEKADYLCTGVNDQATIQLALDKCALTGGTVWLAEGVYFLEIPVGDAALIIPPTVCLSGLGQSYDGAAMLEMQNVTDPGRQALVRMRGNSEVRNLTFYSFDSALGIQLTDFEGFMKITDCWIETRNGAPIEGVENNEVWIERNLIYCSFDPQSEDDSGIHIGGPAGIVDLFITRNWILGGWHSIFLDGDQGRNFIQTNYISQPFFSGIRLKNDVNPIFATTITGNLVSVPGQESDGSTGEAGVYISADGTKIDPTTAQSNGLIIADNVVEVASACHGIRLTDVCLVNVHDNYIEQQGLHGIYLDTANGCQIHDNTIQEPNTFPVTSFDGIHLVDSDDNYIRMNTVVERRGGSPAYFRYAINVSNAACDRNIVVGNDLRLAGSGTGFINNAGTGTRTVFPGAAAPIGDNFV